MVTSRRGRCVLVALAVATMIRTAAASTVPDWAAALERPTLRGAGIDAAGRTLGAGHLSLSQCRGRLYPVVVLDRVVGVYLHGGATLSYASADPLEAATFRTNVERTTSWKLDAKGGLSAVVEGALVMMSAGAEAHGDGAGWLAGEPPAAATAALAKHVERFSMDLGARYQTILAQALVEPPVRPLVMAEIVTGKDDLSHLVDTLREHDESLWVWDEIESIEKALRNKRVALLLSSQPIERPRLGLRPQRFFLTDVDLTLANPHKMRIEIEARETFQAAQPLRTLDLYLWNTRFVTTGPSSTLAENAYVLESVTLPDGQPVAFAHRSDDLVVELPRQLAAGESVTLKFRLAGEVAYRPEGDSYWWLGTEGWFPSPSRADTPRFTYHAVLKVAKPFVPFSCGATVRRWEEGELSCAQFREEKPVHYVTALAGKYETVRGEGTAPTITVSTYAGKNEKAARKIINLVEGLLEFYKFYLGAYPFAELKVVEINAYGFGQAPPGIVFITKEAFNPLQDDMTRLYSEDVNARLAHEVAHTWWGHVAIRPAPEDQWIAESVAEYMSAFAVGNLWKKSKFNEALGNWRGSSKFVKDKGTVYLANQLSGENAAEDRFGLLYGKGPLVLHALRQELGDQVFFTILKSFITNFTFKPAETRNFVRITSYIAKKDYGPFFDRYILGTEWPEK